MGFLNDLLFYGSGDECPEVFQLWSGLSLLSSVLGRKVWMFHGKEYFQVLPNLYVVLVGDAGSGKSTAKGRTKKIFTSQFPEYQTSASFQSHQDIIDLMCNMPDKTWKDEKGEYNDKIAGQLYGYKPFYIISNELASLLSTDKKGMVEFLVDIYDENEFSTGYKGQRRDTPERKQQFANPYVSVLCCAVPKWFMGNLKLDLFDGGLGRRLVIVYSDRTKLVPDPEPPPGGVEALLRAVDHLREAEKLYGEIKRTPAGATWWKEWYMTRKKEKDDPILMQFDETLPIQVLKVALLLSLCERPFKMELTDEHLITGERMLRDLRPGIKKLTSGIGRNELAGVGSQLLDYLSRMGGAAGEIMVRKFFRRYLNNREFLDVVNSYISSQELYVASLPVNGITRQVWMLPDAFDRFQMKQFDLGALLETHQETERKNGNGNLPSDQNQNPL